MTDQLAPLILVVDDDAMNREIMQEFLATEDYRVRLARDGEDGIQQARDHLPDLVLVDLKMPDMTGYEVCETLKADPATQHIPLVVVTGFNGSEEEQRARTAGADGFLTRTSNIDYFIKIVQQHLPA